MSLLAALLLAVAQPPAAYIDTGTAHVPLAVSSWCWGTHCGAPIAASRRAAIVKRGSLVRVVLRFAPTQVSLAVSGRTVRPTTNGSTVSWPATRGGGVTLRVTARQGWVTYVGRLVLHA